jgi:hypothetical protein
MPFGCATVPLEFWFLKHLKGCHFSNMIESFLRHLCYTEQSENDNEATGNVH